MELLVVFFAVFFLAVAIGAPLWGAEDRPGFKRPDRKLERPPVGSWFSIRH